MRAGGLFLKWNWGDTILLGCCSPRAFLQRAGEAAEKEAHERAVRALSKLLLQGGAVWGARWTARVPSLVLEHHPLLVPQVTWREKREWSWVVLVVCSDCSS